MSRLEEDEYWQISAFTMGSVESPHAGTAPISDALDSEDPFGQTALSITISPEEPAIPGQDYTQANDDLWNDYHGKLMGYFLGKLRPYQRHLAEDFAQETLLKVHHGLPTYVDRGIPFSHFVKVIARNTWVDYVRSQAGKQATLSFNDGFKHDVQTSLEIDWFANPAQVVERKLFMEDISEYVASLPPATRAAMLARMQDIGPKNMQRAIK